ncbi:hypothetical protein ACLOJK_015233, partial [Asimina triloba]
KGHDCVSRSKDDTTEAVSSAQEGNVENKRETTPRRRSRSELEAGFKALLWQTELQRRGFRKELGAGLSIGRDRSWRSCKSLPRTSPRRVAKRREALL